MPLSCRSGRARIILRKVQWPFSVISQRKPRKGLNRRYSSQEYRPDPSVRRMNPTASHSPPASSPLVPMGIRGLIFICLFALLSIFRFLLVASMVEPQ